MFDVPQKNENSHSLIYEVSLLNCLRLELLYTVETSGQDIEIWEKARTPKSQHQKARTPIILNMKSRGQFS
jgi:hypothetical protein